MKLVYVTPYNVSNGQNTISETIPLSSSELLHVPCKRKTKNDKNAPYAILINTYKDVEAMWQADHTRMELQITAKHSLSGFATVISKPFGDKDMVLKYGKFDHGDSLKIIEEKKF